MNSIELINITPFNPLISKCQIKVCWVGQQPNRNKSIITKEVATEMANSLPGSPIVGHYNEATGDFEEHNKLIKIAGGKIKLEPDTQPYGFVDLNAKVWFQWFQDYDGVTREYLVTEGWLWTGQFPECQRVINDGNNHSMELSENPEYLNAYWTKDANGNKEFFIINEAIISKLCILGEEYEPCFEGGSIEAPKIEFSFEKDFREQLFSMMNEIKIILEKGGKSMYTTYAVEIGDSLWSAIYDYLVENYPEDDYCSKYNIEGIYEEDGQKFAIIRDRATMEYYRLNFSLNEDAGFIAEGDLVEVEKTFVPSENPQFPVEEYEAYVSNYAAKKKEEKEEAKPEDKEEEEKEVCPECGKPVDECECEKEEEEKPAKYVLEEIPEYVELQNAHSDLETKFAEIETKFNQLSEDYTSLKAENDILVEFKASIDKKAKEDMINSFYMLSDELKKEVVDNIDSYSLEDIEAKLSVLCVRNKVSFSLEDDRKEADPISYNLNDFGASSNDNVPEWIKAIQDHVAEN